MAQDINFLNCISLGYFIVSPRFLMERILTQSSPKSCFPDRAFCRVNWNLG